MLCTIILIINFTSLIVYQLNNIRMKKCNSILRNIFIGVSYICLCCCSLKRRKVRLHRAVALQFIIEGSGRRSSNCKEHLLYIMHVSRLSIISSNMILVKLYCTEINYLQLYKINIYSI